MHGLIVARRSGCRREIAPRTGSTLAEVEKVREPRFGLRLEKAARSVQPVADMATVAEQLHVDGLRCDVGDCDVVTDDV